MADTDYVRLAAACHCGEPVKLWSGCGRKPRLCVDHARLKEPTPPPPSEARRQETKQCPVCRGIFVSAQQSGRPKTYCSSECRDSRNHEAKKEKLKAAKVSKPKSQQTCCQCRQSFMGSRKKKYCSKRCCWVAQGRKKGHRPKAEVNQLRRNEANWFTCEGCGKDCHRRLSGTNKSNGAKNRWCSMECRRASALPSLCAYFARYCGTCSKPFGAKRSETLDCESCRNARYRETFKAAAEALHRAAGRITKCEGCGLQYCILHRAGRMPLCSGCVEDRANADRRARRIARKATQRAATVELVDPIRVFERAGWRCYLCGCATPRELRGTYDPKAPELEHVVPLSKGGDHSYANTDCACRACNLEKADQTLEELLD